MPVGVDTNLFKPEQAVVKKPRSILFLARMSPVKKPDLLIRALVILKDRGVHFTADFYGDPALADVVYYQGLIESIKTAQLIDQVNFLPSVPNYQTPAIYTSHKIFVNLSSSGMYDKTIFEAMACGALTLVSNDNLKGLMVNQLLLVEGDVNDLANKLEALLELSDADSADLVRSLREVVNQHSLTKLVEKINQEIV